MIVCLVLSVVILIATLCLIIYSLRNQKIIKNNLILGIISFVGVSLSLLVLSIPIIFSSDISGVFSIFYFIIVAFFGDTALYTSIEKNLNSQLLCVNDSLLDIYLVVLAIASVLAVLTTALTILYIVFHGFKYAIRYKWYIFRWRTEKYKLFVFNEVNENTISIAESVCKKDKIYEAGNEGKEKLTKCIFTDAYLTRKEVDIEFEERINEIKGALVKKSIVDVDKDIRKRNHRNKNLFIEYFLFGSDETENMSHAISIAKNDNKVNKSRNIHISMYSTTNSERNSLLLQELSIPLRNIFVFNEINDNTLSLAESILKTNEKTEIIFIEDNSSKKEKVDKLKEDRKATNVEIKEKISIVDEENRIRKQEYRKISIKYFLLANDNNKNIYDAVLIENNDNENYCINVNVKTYISDAKSIKKLYDNYERECDFENGLYELYKTYKSLKDNISNKSDMRGYYDLSIENNYNNVSYIFEYIKNTFSIISIPINPLYTVALSSALRFLYSLESAKTVKQIKVLILGFGQQGIEMLKVLSWILYTNLNISLTFVIVDKECDIDDRFYGECPGCYNSSDQYVYIDDKNPDNIQLKDMNNKFNLESVKNNDVCKNKYVFVPGVDVNSMTFRKLVNNDDPNIKKLFSNIDYAFVSLGDDNVNLSASLKLRRLLASKSEDDNIYRTKIDAVVYDKLICSVYESELKNNNFQINISGTTDKIYNYDTLIKNIVQYFPTADKEKGRVDKYFSLLGFQSHLLYSLQNLYNNNYENGIKNINDNNDKKLEPQDIYMLFNSAKSYFVDGYNRKASISKAIHIDYNYFISKVFDNYPNEVRAKFEHNRWMKCIRSEGYIYGDKRSNLEKKHPDIIVYKKLPEGKRVFDD